MPYANGTSWNGSSWTSTGIRALEPLSRCEDTGDGASTGSEPSDVQLYDGTSDSFWEVNESGQVTNEVHVLPGNKRNGSWDGDRRLEKKSQWGTRDVNDPQKGNLSPFDIDNDGNVELPFATDPTANNYARQYDDDGNPYTKARVTQFLATHEIGHALAGDQHSTVKECTMFQESLNWKRDHYLSDQVRENVEVHNHMRSF